MQNLGKNFEKHRFKQFSIECHFLHLIRRQYGRFSLGDCVMRIVLFKNSMSGLEKCIVIFVRNVMRINNSEITPVLEQGMRFGKLRFWLDPMKGRSAVRQVKRF